MGIIDSIASFAGAQSMANVQIAAAMKVLKLSQSQGQAVAEMVDSAMQNLQSSIENMSSDLGCNCDTYA